MPCSIGTTVSCINDKPSTHIEHNIKSRARIYDVTGTWPHRSHVGSLPGLRIGVAAARAAGLCLRGVIANDAISSMIDTLLASTNPASCASRITWPCCVSMYGSTHKSSTAIPKDMVHNTHLINLNTVQLP